MGADDVDIQAVLGHIEVSTVLHAAEAVCRSVPNFRKRCIKWLRMPKPKITKGRLGKRDAEEGILIPCLEMDTLLGTIEGLGGWEGSKSGCIVGGESQDDDDGANPRFHPCETSPTCQGFASRGPGIHLRQHSFMICNSVVSLILCFRPECPIVIIGGKLFAVVNM